MALPMYLSYDMTLEPHSASPYHSQSVVGTAMTALAGADCPASGIENGKQTQLNNNATPAKDFYEDMFQEISKKLYADGVVFQPVSEQQLSLLLQCQQHTAQSESGFMDLNYQQGDKDGYYPSEGTNTNGKATHTPSTSNLTTTPTHVKKPNTFEPKELLVEASNWVESEEFLPWHTTTKVASYNATLRKFKCLDCGCTGLISQIVEHWVGMHSNMRVFKCPCCDFHSAWASCIRSHFKLKHWQLIPHGNSRFRWRENPVLESVTKYLFRLKNRLHIGIVSGGSRSDKNGQTDPLNHHEQKACKCCICNKPLNRSDPNQKHFCSLHREMVNKLQTPTTEQVSDASAGYMNSTTDVVGQQDHMIQSTRTPKPSQVPLYTSAMAVEEQHPLQLVAGTAAYPPSSSGSVKKTKEKLYGCNYCPWRGVDNWSLKRHFASHNKPFLCPVCNYRTGRKYRLVAHARNCHQKWLCSKCTFVADCQDALGQHMRKYH